jgi:hypothetical protein
LFGANVITPVDIYTGIKTTSVAAPKLDLPTEDSSNVAESVVL